jgi:pimeloyl-ACP methyl ester carboxylesterase
MAGNAPWTTWDRRDSGPADAEHTVLCLPGGMCTASFYAELFAEPALAGVRMVAVTLPGNGGTPAPDDVSIGNYARLTAEAARDLGADVIVGHSMGANVALEMVATGAFRGPLILLAPSFSRADEDPFFRGVDRISSALGDLPYRAMRLAVGGMTKKMPVTPDRRAELAADLRRNDPKTMRRMVREYFRYLDRHGSVAQRLCDADVPAWVVLGESGDGGATDAERKVMAPYAKITMVTIKGKSFFTPNESPALVADLTAQALARTTARG